MKSDLLDPGLRNRTYTTTTSIFSELTSLFGDNTNQKPVHVHQMSEGAYILRKLIAVSLRHPTLRFNNSAYYFATLCEWTS